MGAIDEGIRRLGLGLGLAELEDVRHALHERLVEGLAADGREIAMIPAWLAPPGAGLAGEALAIDAGGTHLRAARVRLPAGGGPPRVVKAGRAPLPGAKGTPASDAIAFWAAHAALGASLGVAPGMPVGYCFSYPSSVTPGGDATLLQWTKEVRVDGVEGSRVGSALSRAFEAAGHRPGPVFVLNDTVATLAAGSAGPGADPARTVGLIVGTGTNQGAWIPAAAIPKLAAPWGAPAMAVNFESGAFWPPHLGPIDDAVDAGSGRPGRQRFEKAVSGAYLPHLLAEASSALGLPPPEAPDGEAFSRLAADPGGSPQARLARALLDRSADLVAAALAATSDLLTGPGDLRVCAEGSLVARAPGYRERLVGTLGRLLASRGAAVSGRVFERSEANLVGSALAALQHAARRR